MVQNRLSLAKSNFEVLTDDAYLACLMQRIDLVTGRTSDQGSTPPFDQEGLEEAASGNPFGDDRISQSEYK